MRRVHAAAVPRGLGHDDDQRKAMEDEILRLKESVEALKASRNELEAEKRGMHLQHKKVVDLVKGRHVADLEAIPPEFLTKDKGTEKYIAQLQQKVEGLKRTNRKVTDANTKLREKIKTASRGTVPSRVMQPRAHHAAQPPAALRAVSSSSGSRTAARGASATPAAAASAADLSRHVGVGTSPVASAAAAVDAGTSPLATSAAPIRGAAQQSSLHIQQVLSPEWQALDTTPAERPHSATLPASGAKAVSFGTALGSGSAGVGAAAAAAAAGGRAEAPFALERDASSLRQPSRPHAHPQQVPLQQQPSSAVLMGEAAMRGPPAAPTAAVPASHKRRDILQNFADAGVAADQRSGSAAALESARLDELFGRSEHAMAEKTSVIFHLETLVVGLKEQLEASEAAILGLQDEVLKYKVERDEAVKGRDLNTREKDVCLEERDYAIRAKAKLEADLLLCADEIALLRRDRERIREDYDAACARSRGERSRCDQLEGQQLEAFEELQQTLKEKTAALLVLDTRHRESEEKARALHAANVDMLEEMQRLSAQLGKERIASRGRDAEMERLRLDLEGVDAKDEQHRRLREEYVILQREHTETLDKILGARSVGDIEVRREAAAEVAQLKQAVSKWEAASKTQFKQYQSTLLKLKDATDRAEALQKENGTLGCRVAELEADKQHLENKVKLLFMYKREVEGMPAGGGGGEGGGEGEGGEADGHLDEERVSEIVMAMEIVQRSKGTLGMKDMVRQLTGEEREDALVDLQGTNEQLQRDLMLLHKTNKQLKERLATQELDARRQVSLSGLKAKGVNERSAAAQDASRRVIEKQAAQIDNLSRTIRSVVRYGAPAFAPPTPSGAGSPGAGSSVPSITSTLSLESAVGPNDNVLQISFRFAHFVSEDVARLFAASDAGDAQPAILASLDFFDFETVATQEHFLRTRAPPPAEDRVNACVFPDPVDFDSHFIFKVTENDDLLRYLSTKGCAVRLRRRGGGGADDVVANGLLSCCALLGSETRRFAQGRLALHAPSTQAHHRGAVLAYLDVVAKLKRPLAFASVADARIRFPVPAFATRGLDAVENADAAEREEATGDGRGLARPGTAAVAPAILPVSVEVAAQERLADVVGLRVRLTDVALERPARCSVFTSFNGVDVWFAQLGAEPTRTPGFGSSDVDPAADRVVEAFPAEQRPLLEALFAGGLPLVLFDDTEPEVTDCVGSASVPTRALLERPVGQRLEAGVTFVSSAGVPAGTAQVSLEWQLRTRPPSRAGSPAATGVLPGEDGEGDAAC